MDVAAQVWPASVNIAPEEAEELGPNGGGEVRARVGGGVRTSTRSSATSVRRVWSRLVRSWRRAMSPHPSGGMASMGSSVASWLSSSPSSRAAVAMPAFLPGCHLVLNRVPVTPEASPAPAPSRLAPDACPTSPAPPAPPPDDQRAGEVDGIEAGQAMLVGQVAGERLDLDGDLDTADGGSQLLPRCRGRPRPRLVEASCSSGGRQGGTHLRVGDAAREERVGTVPEPGGLRAARFLDDELHQGAGVEVGDGHRRRSRSSATRSLTEPRPLRRSVGAVRLDPGGPGRAGCSLRLGPDVRVRRPLRGAQRPKCRPGRSAARRRGVT